MSTVVRTENRNDFDSYNNYNGFVHGVEIFGLADATALADRLDYFTQRKQGLAKSVSSLGSIARSNAAIAAAQEYQSILLEAIGTGAVEEDTQFALRALSSVQGNVLVATDTYPPAAANQLQQAA